MRQGIFSIWLRYFHGCCFFSSFYFSHQFDRLSINHCRYHRSDRLQVQSFSFYVHYSFLRFSFILAFLLKLTASRHLCPPPVPIMGAQWQQYYWNHYLLQQQQHQLASGTDATQYTPTTTYGPMGHSIRMRQQHQAQPYTPSPSTSPPSDTPPTSTTPAFPPPPPTTPYSITRNATTEVLQAQPHSLGSTCTSSYSSISNTNHPGILALHGFLFKLKCPSRASTPPSSHPAHPMVPTCRDRRLADF